MIKAVPYFKLFNYGINGYLEAAEMDNSKGRQEEKEDEESFRCKFRDFCQDLNMIGVKLIVDWRIHPMRRLAWAVLVVGSILKFLCQNSTLGYTCTSHINFNELERNIAVQTRNILTDSL